MAARRTSWNYDLNSYEAKRLLNLAEEPAFEQAVAVSDRNTPVSDATWKSTGMTNATHQGEGTQISRANSDLSLYTPVRRRSMMHTPGVATRARTMTNSAPPRQNFRHSVPPTPSISRQQSFESMRSGVISMPPRALDPDSMPRVVTPSELEYQSIGAFKLGSLRITNGAASPVSPELEKKGKAGEPSATVTPQRGDYFSATPVGPSETVEALHYTAQTVVAPQPRALNLSPIAASVMEAEAARSSSGPVHKDPSPKAADIYLGYLEEMSFTPFSLDDPRSRSPELQTTSKHTAIEDDLFTDEPNLEYSTVEVLDVRLDPNAKSQAAAPQLDTQCSVGKVTRTDSGFVSAGSPSSEAPLKPLSKADSGYSSNVSLRSFTASKSQVADNECKQSVDKNTSLASPTSGPSPSSEQQPQRLSLERPAPPSREPPPPPVPPKDAVPTSPSRLSGSSAFNKAIAGLKEARLSTPSPAGKSRHTPSPIDSMRSHEIGPRSPESIPPTPQSARSDVSASALSIGSGSNRPSKLQRLLSGARRSAHGPPMVHVTHVLDKMAIPSIPQEVETKLNEHAGLFPMTTKRLALKPQQSKDTLKTIFSVGSMEVSLDAMNPTRKSSPALTDDMDDHDGSHARQLVHSVQNSLANAASHFITRKPVTRPIPIPRASAIPARRESAGDAENDMVLAAEAELTSYMSISSSLGNNPYDAAFQAMGDKSNGLLAPPALGERSMSLGVLVERNLHMNVRKMPSASSLLDNQRTAVPSFSLPREPIAVQPKKTKTPPPVSMMTRPNSSLRVQRSLRHHKSAQSLSRKSSRESVHSYPAAGPVQPSLSRRNSREHVQSYPSYQSYPSHQQASPPLRDQTLSPPPIPPMDPRRRSMSLQGQSHPQGFVAPYQAPPSWAVQAQPAAPRRSSMSSMDSGSRNNSFSSSRSYQGSQVQRPASVQPHQGRPSQPLRHRVSYDGYSGIHRGHPPAMSNGYTPPSPRPIIDPWNSNRPPTTPKQDQFGVYPPHVPRGHYRGRSMGSRGSPIDAPYRILHSYNSPAYRNVPIWG